ncbi:hypothetical protein ISS08_00880 [Candidatus Pacearchaeota archaeon]|nr:hypothetical protein [Candidatus Pacearchaeota archaeon]
MKLTEKVGEYVFSPYRDKTMSYLVGILDGLTVYQTLALSQGHGDLSDALLTGYLFLFGHFADYMSIRDNKKDNIRIEKRLENEN